MVIFKSFLRCRKFLVSKLKYVIFCLPSGLKGLAIEPRFDRPEESSGVDCSALSFLSNFASVHQRSLAAPPVGHPPTNTPAQLPTSPSAFVAAAAAAAAAAANSSCATAEPSQTTSPTFQSGLSILAQAASVAKLPIGDR